MAGDGAQLHIVVFPWMAFGHMLPYLEFSKVLASRGHLVSFLSPPRNLQRLQPRVPPSPFSHLLRLVDLPFPAGVPLPPGSEASNDVKPEDNGYLKKAFDALESPFAAFLDSASPPVDWIIHDFTAHWMAPKVAACRRIPCALFSAFAPVSMAFCGAPSKILGPHRDGSGWPFKAEEVLVPPPWISGITKLVAFLPHEAVGFSSLRFVNESGVSDSYRWAASIEAAQLVITRSCPEVDGEWTRLLGDLYCKPIIPAGVLPPTVAAARPSGEIFEWLDGQAAGSVLYVALGTEVALDAELFRELAHGLELSGVQFLWVLRRPVEIPPEIELIPKGFKERTAGMGIVVESWVPQPDVMAHPAVGGYLTHCGWGSFIEALQQGLPLVLLPVFGDQGLLARMAEEKGWGREVPRAVDGKFTREQLAATVRSVTVDAAGEPVRTAAKTAGGFVADDALQESYVDRLVHYLSANKDMLRAELKLNSSN